MSGEVEKKLSEAGETLPEATVPAGNYVGYTVVGDLILVSGQLPFRDGALVNPGIVGAGVSLEQAKEAAKVCGLHVLAQARAANGGSLDGLRCVKLGGFVACTPEFTDQPLVMNGASDLIAAVMGEKGTHSRFAVGAPSLPRGTSVEVEAIFTRA